MSQLSVLALPDKFTRAQTKAAGAMHAESSITYDVDDIVTSLQRRMSLGTNEGMVGRPVAERERGTRIFGLGDNSRRHPVLGPARLGNQHTCQGPPPQEVVHVTNWGWALGLVLFVSLAANILCTAVVVLLSLPAPLNRLAIAPPGTLT